MTEYIVSLIVLGFLLSMAVSIIYKDWWYKKRHYERIIAQYDDFVEMLDEHCGDVIIEAEIKELRRKLGETR